MSSPNRAHVLVTASAALLCLAAGSTPASAQQASTPSYSQQRPQTASLTSARTNDPAGARGQNSSRTQSVQRFLAAASRLTDTIILADRSVAQELIVPPSGTLQPDYLEQTLTQVAHSLPKGTIWAKIYLPTRGKGGAVATWNPDAVADYIIVQSQLFGNVGAPTPAGTIEVMGKRVSGNAASTITTALNLRPVYILMNPLRRDMVVQANIQANQTNQGPLPAEPPQPPPPTYDPDRPPPEK